MNGEVQEQQAEESAFYVSEPLLMGKGWLKFLGVLSIIMGVLSILTISGILVCWIYIWLGILLFQAGSKMEEGHMTKNVELLREGHEKLRSFFTISGIMFIVFMSIAIIGLILFFSFFAAMITQLQPRGF